MKGLPLLFGLFSGDLRNPLPSNALQVKGDMTVMRRILNSKEEGKTWMATSEIDLMLSFLLSDGRYEDMVFIMSAPMTHSIATAFQKFQPNKHYFG